MWRNIPKKKLSAPFLDRVDIHIDVESVPINNFINNKKIINEDNIYKKKSYGC